MAVRGEICNPLVWSSDGNATCPANPFVLFSRYRDNIYLGCANMNSRLLLHVKYVLSIMLRVVYGIPLKCEPHGSEVTWGEAVISTCPSLLKLRLRRKGVCVDLSNSSEAEWHRWIHPRAPNAQLVWRSLVTALVCKSLWYAWDTTDLICNVRSVVWGLTVRGYPSRWWNGRFFRVCARFNLDTFFTKTDVLVWIERAQSFVAAQ